MAKMKRIVVWCMILILLGSQTVYAAEQPSGLYAHSAVLMDAESGRILFEKDGFNRMPMASTTKVMTAIITLENANLEDVVTVSKEAARQPKVRLGMREGEQYYLRDLLYSLMLESHNDSAVAIAEHVGGSVEGFASMMNRKARELGCDDTYFVTPNGLDGIDEGGIHSTTAADLARIMKYAIRESPKSEEFLEITRRASYGFSTVDTSRNFMLTNRNAFLTMMDGALSGKTGFTNKAGYCYVGALERDGRTFIVAILASGWPNNRSYKWSDTKKLMNYGLEHYQYRDVYQEQEFEPVIVENGIPESGNLSDTSYLEVDYSLSEQERSLKVLLREDEQVTVRQQIKAQVEAPVNSGDQVGNVVYILDDEVLKEIPIVAIQPVERISMRWCLLTIWNMYLPLGNVQ